MKRAFFLAGIAGAVFALTSVRAAFVTRTRSNRCPDAGRCADNHRKLRWSGYTAADFS